MQGCARLGKSGLGKNTRGMQAWRPRYLGSKVPTGLGSIWQEGNDQISEDPDF